jgi:hypothetical protein
MIEKVKERQGVTARENKKGIIVKLKLWLK